MLKYLSLMTMFGIDWNGTYSVIKEESSRRFRNTLS